MLGTLVDFKPYNEKAIFAEKYDDESNPDGAEFHIGFRHDLLDADLRRDIFAIVTTRFGPATRTPSTRHRKCRCGRNDRIMTDIAISTTSPARPPRS